MSQLLKKTCHLYVIVATWKYARIQMLKREYSFFGPMLFAFKNK
jgi:hypothetical protein